MLISRRGNSLAVHLPASLVKALPAYAPDDGPLTAKEREAIHALAPQDRSFIATKSLI